MYNKYWKLQVFKFDLNEYEGSIVHNMYTEKARGQSCKADRDVYSMSVPG